MASLDAARSTRSKSLPPCESQWLSWPDFRQKSRRRECLRPASHHSLNRKYPRSLCPRTHLAQVGPLRSQLWRQMFRPGRRCWTWSCCTQSLVGSACRMSHWIPDKASAWSRAYDVGRVFLQFSIKPPPHKRGHSAGCHQPPANPRHLVLCHKWKQSAAVQTAHRGEVDPSPTALQVVRTSIYPNGPPVFSRLLWRHLHLPRTLPAQIHKSQKVEESKSETCTGPRCSSHLCCIQWI